MTTPAPRHPRAWGIALIGWALWAPVLAGFLLHTSPPDAGPRLLGKYSPAYAAFLFGLAAVMAAIPLAALRLARPTRVTTADGRELIIAGWRKVGYVVAGLVLGVAVVLVALVVLPGREPQEQPVPPGRPNDWAVFIESHPLWEDRTNQWGWVGPDLAPGPHPGAVRVFVLGGSTTFLQHLSPAENYTGVLQSALERSRPGRRIEVENASFVGHSSVQSLIKYATLIPDFEPDIVIVMHAVNDVVQGEIDLFESPWARPFERDYGGDAWAFEWLVRWAGAARPARPAACGALARAWRATFASDLHSPRYADDGARRRAADRLLLRARPAFRRNLTSLGRLVRARGARFIVASQPTMMRPGSEAVSFRSLAPEDAAAPPWAGRPDIHTAAWIHAMAEYNATARRAAADVDGRFVDLERAVPPRWRYFDSESLYDVIHMSAEGCHVAADAIHDAVLPLVPEAAHGSETGSAHDED